MTPKGRLLIVGSLVKDVINGEEMYGGSAGVLALTAKWLGLDVGVLSVLGKDSFSQKYWNFLSNNGIRLTLTKKNLEELPVCEMTVTGGSVSACCWQDNGFVQAMERMELTANMIEGYDLVHLVGCPRGVLTKFRSIKQPLSYEPGQRLLHDATCFDQVLTKKARAVFFNEEEYRVISQNYKLLSDNLVVVTIGDKGCLVRQKRFEASEIMGEIADTIGAGDNFKAGFLAGLLTNRTITECVRIASDLGAESVIHRGAILPQLTVEAIRNRYRL